MGLKLASISKLENKATVDAFLSAQIAFSSCNRVKIVLKTKGDSK
jgi:hypothetical protein